MEGTLLSSLTTYISPSHMRNLIHRRRSQATGKLIIPSSKCWLLEATNHHETKLTLHSLATTQHLVMATSYSHMVSIKLSMLGWSGGRREVRNRRAFFISAQQQTDVEEAESAKIQEEQEQVESQKVKPKGTKPRPVEPQLNVKSKNMSREYGGQWLSCATRHVRIYAAYIDPETCEFDQTQMDKLTLILDPTDEFVWNPETCNQVYSYFQELVDHYEGAPLTEYTLRLIGSDIEHYIRRMLYDGEIKYNMNAKVLNFSMGKPRIMLNNDIQPEDTLEK